MSVQISQEEEISFKIYLIYFQLPTISTGSIQAYLDACHCTLGEKAKKLYDERFLLCVRSAPGSAIVLLDTLFLHARCTAEMKRQIPYAVDVSIDSNGSVLESQCECAVGQGPSARYKHMFSAFSVV